MRNPRPLRRLAAAVIGLFALAGATGPWAEPLPSPEDLREKLGQPPLTVRVREPHLPEGDPASVIAYLGYPVATVLAAVLGPDWQTQGDHIAFQALDGYVSRVSTARLASGKGFLAIGRSDGARFQVDNALQNEKAIPLGPYYLVWDNTGSAAPAAADASAWPYQAAEVLPFDASLMTTALLPPGLAPEYRNGAELTGLHCLNCHKVNGYGGSKFETDLTVAAKKKPAADLVAWLLDPRSVRPATTMPPLAPTLPHAKRQDIAAAIVGYLTHVPARP